MHDHSQSDGTAPTLDRAAAALNALPRSTGVLTTDGVAEGLTPVTLVFHDEEDGGWQFLDTGAGGRAASLSHAVIAPLGELLDTDPSLREIGGLKAGWVATRSAPGEPWRIERRRHGIGSIFQALADLFGGGGSSERVTVDPVATEAFLNARSSPVAASERKLSPSVQRPTEQRAVPAVAERGGPVRANLD